MPVNYAEFEFNFCTERRGEILFRRNVDDTVEVYTYDKLFHRNPEFIMRFTGQEWQDFVTEFANRYVKGYNPLTKN